MRGLKLRTAAGVSVAALGAAGLVALTPVAANAAVSGGTVTLTVSSTFISQLAHSGVALVPKNAASVTYNSTTGNVTITYTATGGDATLVNSAGTVTYSGGILGFSCDGGIHTVSLSGLQFDLTAAQFDGATSTSGETPLVDLAGNQFGLINADGSQTYSSSDLVVDAAGAALLDSALHTNAFTAGQDVGSFTTTWTVS